MRLKASLLAVELKKFQCGFCLKQFSSRKDGAEMLEKTQTMQGCKQKVSHTVHMIPITDGNGWNIGSVQFNRCPGNFMQSDIGHWLDLSNHIDNGVMPYPGSPSEQPAKAMEILGVIGDWKADRKKKAEEAANRKAKSGGKRRG